MKDRKAELETKIKQLESTIKRRINENILFDEIIYSGQFKHGHALLRELIQRNEAFNQYDESRISLYTKQLGRY